MNIAFYKSKFGNWQDKLISALTFGPYSHCELVFTDKIGFSSSPRDGGTRFKYIDWESGHWDFIQLAVSESTEARIRNICLTTLVGFEYDWIGVLFPFGILENPNKLYCSEVIASILRCNNLVDLKTNQVNPNQLYRSIIKSI